jgi:hypothetical protein
MDWTLGDLIYIGIISIINIFIIIAYFEIRFFTIRRKLRKINQILEEHLIKLTNIESKFTHKIEKEKKKRIKNRKQKLTKIKNEIDEILHEKNQ